MSATDFTGPERITRAMVDKLAEHVSGLFPAYGVAVRGYNGGYGIDLTYTRDDGREAISRTLTFGTKREILEYLRAMREGALLVNENRS